MAGTLMCPAVPLWASCDLCYAACPVGADMGRGCSSSLIESCAPVSVTRLRCAGYLSWRSHVWTDVDNARCGTLPFVFDPDFGFERYVDYALQVPMYFVYR